jgi:hypothetical protein
VVRRIGAKVDAKAKKKTKVTTFGIQHDIFEKLESAARKQKTTVTAMFLISLEETLRELIELKSLPKDRDNSAGKLGFTGEITARLAKRKDKSDKGYHYLTIRIPSQIHDALKREALRYKTTMVRIVTIMLESVSTYALYHPWYQYEFDLPLED